VTLQVSHWGDNCRAMGLLTAAATLSACTTQIPISHMEPAPIPAPIEMRPLSSGEKTALTKTLAQIVPNPGAAQFRWLPIATNGSGPIGYCGLINVKTDSGQYVGFRRFFAMLAKGPKGDYAKGQIEHIDGIAIPATGNPEAPTLEMGLTEENCKEWGYTDFSGAM
jgi:hypothetical protein